jgi:hypothetical protein
VELAIGCGEVDWGGGNVAIDDWGGWFRTRLKMIEAPIMLPASKLPKIKVFCQFP